MVQNEKFHVMKAWQSAVISYTLKSAGFVKPRGYLVETPEALLDNLSEQMRHRRQRELEKRRGIIKHIPSANGSVKRALALLEEFRARPKERLRDEEYATIVAPDRNNHNAVRRCEICGELTHGRVCAAHGRYMANNHRSTVAVQS
jgi:hypothetical protein